MNYIIPRFRLYGFLKYGIFAYMDHFSRDKRGPYIRNGVNLISTVIAPSTLMMRTVSPRVERTMRKCSLFVLLTHPSSSFVQLIIISFKILS